jgi:hypothetical protein
MERDITKGERPTVTSLVGASAAPSHALAAKPDITPSTWSERDRAREEVWDANFFPFAGLPTWSIPMECIPIESIGTGRDRSR